MSGTISTLAEMRSTPWAIMSECLDGLVVQATEATESRLQMRMVGEDIYAIKGKRLPSVRGTIAVVPIRGVITQHGFGGLFGLMFGGVSLDVLGEEIDRLVADEDVGAIVLDIDSPGGSVYGTTEMAAKIQAARDIKPIVAVANSMATSAAYDIAASASQVVATPGGQVGSIGVLNVHMDTTEAEEAEGIKTTVISAGEYKAEGWGPLTEEAEAAMKKQVNAYYETFVSDVAKGRGVTPKLVKETYGQGRVVNAEDALRAGMVDRVATLEETIKTMSKSQTPKRDAANRRARMMGM